MAMITATAIPPYISVVIKGSERDGIAEVAGVAAIEKILVLDSFMVNSLNRAFEIRV